ncbi:MAG: hypothetical protein U7127_23805 [Phormidium sp.]
MSPIIYSLKKALHKVLVSTLIVFLSVSALVLFPSQESLAEAPTLRQPMQTQIDNSNQSKLPPEKSYDEEINALKDPQSVEKEYEENLEAYKETQPDKGIIEEAKSLVEKVTGQ